MNTPDPMDPHHDQPILFSGSKPEDAKGAIIMAHGRGATAESILSLADELPHNGKLTIAGPQAAGNSWYPNSFVAPRKSNEPYLSSALKFIGDIVGVLFLRGIKYENIILLGFSQGACLITEYAAQNARRYGGIVTLSGGLIGETLDEDSYTGNFSDTPVFLGCSDIDPHIPLKRVNETEGILEKHGAKITKKIYPGMGHTITRDELKYISLIIQRVLM
jgi:phospholipase/carboxylesterase